MELTDVFKSVDHVLHLPLEDALSVVIPMETENPQLAWLLVCLHFMV